MIYNDYLFFFYTSHISEPTKAQIICGQTETPEKISVDPLNLKFNYRITHLEFSERIICPTPNWYNKMIVKFSDFIF